MRVKKFRALCKMSKDEFNKRLLRKYPTPEKRRELYGKLVDQEEDLLEIYDKKSETEQVVAIRNRIKFIYEITKTYLKHLTRYR